MSGRVGFVVVALAGYLLGRTRKLKLALRAASAIAGLNKGQDIVSRTTKALDSPAAKLLVNRVAGTLVQAAEGALTTAVSERVRSVSESLQGRSEKLRAPHERAGKERLGKGPRTAGKAAPPAVEEAGTSRETWGRSPGGSSKRSSGAGRSAPRPAAPRGKRPRPAHDQALSGRQGRKPTS